MANTNSPFGARPIRSLIGEEIKVNKYTTQASDNTPIYVGDFVSTNNVFDSRGIPVCVKSAVGDDIRGIVVGITASRTNSDDENIIYRAGAEVRDIEVCDDPYILFTIQVNGTLTTDDAGKNSNIILGTPSNATGISGTELDLSTITTETAQIKIIRLVASELNELGSNSQVIGWILQHELDHSKLGPEDASPFKSVGGIISPQVASNTLDMGSSSISSTFVPVSNEHVTNKLYVDSHSSNGIWTKAGINISPSTAGNNLTMGSGDVSATNGTFTGKLTVGGLIDPTALVLDPQSSAPSTANGTIYYDSNTNSFRLRENGTWFTPSGEALWDRTGTVLSPQNVGDTLDMGSASISSTFVPVSNEHVANKLYVDSHSSNGMWTRNGTDLEPANAGDNVDLTTGGLKDNYVTTAIPLGDTSNTALDTVNKTLVGAINEVNSIVPRAVTDSFTPTPGQTVFTLSQTPNSNDSVSVYLNGQRRRITSDYTLSGNTLTWINPDGILLTPDDRLDVTYNSESIGAVVTIWDRTGTTITPANSGDTLDMEAASISSTFVPTADQHVANKLYVDNNSGHKDIWFFAWRLSTGQILAGPANTYFFENFETHGGVQQSEFYKLVLPVHGTYEFDFDMHFSLDIGAGSTDIEILTYKDETLITKVKKIYTFYGNALLPTYWNVHVHFLEDFEANANINLRVRLIFSNINTYIGLNNVAGNPVAGTFTGKCINLID